MHAVPSRIEPANDHEAFIEWHSGERYLIPYRTLRLQCPCAGCVNELTGEVTLQESSVPKDVHPTTVELVGNYAIQFDWSDKHRTGMYHFDRLFELCKKAGKPLEADACEHGCDDHH